MKAVSPEKIVSHDKDLLNKSMFYSFSLYIRMFVKILSGLFIAKILGPYLYGLKNAFELILSYESNSDLGTFDALNRQVPYYRGENDLNKVAEAFSTIFWMNIIYAGIAAVCLCLTSYYLKVKGVNPQYVELVFFLGIAVLTSKLCSFFDTKAKIDKQLYLLGRVEIVNGLAASIMGILLTYLYGFRGAILSLIIADLIFIYLIFHNEKRIPKFNVSFNIFRGLLKIGLPINLLFLLFMFFDTADRAIILAMLSAEALGFYSIAIVATGIIEIIPGAVHSVTFVPVMEKFGKTKSRESIRNYFTDPMVIMAYLMPFLMALLFFGIHLPITWFLEDYTRSILIVKILTMGIFFSAISFPAISMSLAFNKQTTLLCILIPLVGLNYCLNFIFVKAGWDIEGVAVATSIAYFFQFCVLTYFVTVQFGDSFKKYIQTIRFVLVPYAYAVFLLFNIEFFMTKQIITLVDDVLFTIAKIAVFVFLYGILIVLNRKNSIFVKLFDNLNIVSKTQDNRLS